MLDRQVPYYHHSFPASYFTGWRGKVVLLLNFARYWLTRFMEQRVMLYILTRQGADEPTLQAFKQRWSEESAKPGRRSTLASLGAFGVERDSVQDSYQRGRKNGLWPEDPGDRSAATLARYNVSKQAQAYRLGREESMIEEVDAVAVKKEE